MPDRSRRCADYDPFAWLYDKHWTEVPREILGVMDKLLVPRLPRESRILDLCCGTGQIAAELSERGFEVTGLDRSAEMLRLARENARGVEFIKADARAFDLPPIYDAVISTFDSLNHMMSLEELTSVFRNVHRTLATAGFFFFDMNMEAGFIEHWRDYYAIVEADHVGVLRGEYDRDEKIGRYDMTLFRLAGETWWRADTTITERCYTAREVKAALKRAGFKEISTYDAVSDAGLADHTGRMFFLTRPD